LDSLALNAQNTEGALTVMTNLALGLVNVVGAIIGTLIIVGAQIVAGIVSGILKSLGIELEPALFSELGTILSSIATNALIAAKLIGINIILGISQGIVDTVSDLITTLEQIGLIITETVKSTLGISSPSTIFFDFGTNIVQGLIDGILSLAESIPEVLGGLFEGAAELFGGLFGGGGEEAQAPTLTFDPAEMLAGMENVNVAIGNVNLALTNITIITLPLLQETFLIVTTLIIEQMILLLETGIMPIDLALVIMTTVTLPNLQATAIAVAAAIIAAFVPVEVLFQNLIKLMIELTTETEKFGVAAEKAGKDAAKGFDSAAKKLKEKLIPAMKDAVVVAQLLAQALKEVSDAVNAAGGAAESATGTGFAKGIGFQAGTPANTGGLLGLGFQIPGTGFGDTFGPMFLEPGEELLVTPRGTSIEGLIFSRLANLLRGTTVQGGSVTNNTTNIEMNMNIQTGSSAQANIQQFAVMKGLVGA
jgi:hypothetical protein